MSARPGYRSPEGVFTDAGLGRLVDELARNCATLEVALAAIPKRSRLHDHRLSIDGERFHPLPRMQSLARGFWRAGPCRAVIEDLEARTDALVVQLPFAAPLALTRGRRPRLYHVCADVLQQAHTAGSYAGVKRIPALAVGTAIDRLQRQLIHRNHDRVVTHGEHLYQHYAGRGRAVVSSALFAHEIQSVVRRRPPDAPFRVLFVGYLRHEKGIDTLLQAFTRLRRVREDAELVIVGGTDMVDTGVERLLAEAGDERVARTGPIGFGSELFQQFADADVLAVPSRSEGTPRVLIEARAFGCPVVASRVGGTPTSVADGIDGLLFPAGDADALTEHLVSIARDAELRERLVREGIARARQTTVTDFAGELLEELELLLVETAAAPAENPIDTARVSA